MHVTDVHMLASRGSSAGQSVAIAVLRLLGNLAMAVPVLAATSDLVIGSLQLATSLSDLFYIHALRAVQQAEQQQHQQQQQHAHKSEYAPLEPQQASAAV
jgi:hypothetical protein